MKNQILIKFLNTISVIFAVSLGIGEAVINWGDWQFPPLWIVDYMIVVVLLLGVLKSSIEILFGGWCFSFGVMYMALFINLAPEFESAVDGNEFFLILLFLVSLVSLLGVLLSWKALKHQIKKSNMS